MPESALRRGMTLMACRGPDDEGMYSRPGVLLGHRRLAVIDLQGGSQPFIDEETGTALVFNGEIFNYLELRDELISHGHLFVSESDTEVLMRAYLQWDIRCLDHLSGMFAFAVYDPGNHRLLLARDRLGIKPLFFSRHGPEIMFASTCSALRCFPHVGSEMDLCAVSHYLTTIRTTLGRRTLLRDIQALLPGEYLVMKKRDSQPLIRKYWDIPIKAPGDKDNPGIDAAARHVRELLADSVARQLISDVPLGGFLSGGIDSSILAALACPMTSGNFNAYSVGYDRDGYNEWPYIKSAVDCYGMNCRQIHPDEKEFPATWKKLVGVKGLPISTPNEIAIYHLAKALRQDFTVALSGEGADEIFGGYTIPYFSAYDFERARRSAPTPGETLTATDRAIQRCYRRPYILCRPDHYFLVNSWIPFDQKRSLLTDEIWDSIDQDSALFNFYEEWFDRLDKCSTFDAYMHIHARVNLEGLLFRVDSSTMAASVEARVPFTDHKIVEYLFGLPDHYKIDWKNESAGKAGQELNITEIDKQGLLQSKILLRKAFHSDVPPDIMTRPKLSFPVPFREWFADWMNPIARNIIQSSVLVGGIFDPVYVKRILDTAGHPQSAMALWPLTNLCLWQQECGIKLP